jgi:Transposase IS116/IS110/IS902 family
VAFFWNTAFRCGKDLRQQLPQLLATRTDVLSPRILRIIGDIVDDSKYLDDRIERVTDEIEALARTDVNCGQLMTVPGIGPIIASAKVAAIGNGAAFAKGRDFAAWLGLVPKQMSTGDRTILGRITKRGNRYLRMLFVQGDRAILLRAKSWAKHSFGSWLTAAARRTSQDSDNRARQQAGADRFDCLDPRPQLRNAHRIGSRVIELNGIYRGRPTWIANVNDQYPVIPAGVCELDGGDGETVWPSHLVAHGLQGPRRE